MNLSNEQEIKLLAKNIEDYQKEPVTILNGKTFYKINSLGNRSYRRRGLKMYKGSRKWENLNS